MGRRGSKRERRSEKGLTSLGEDEGYVFGLCAAVYRQVSI